jgi:hypothetical protein
VIHNKAEMPTNQAPQTTSSRLRPLRQPSMASRNTRQSSKIIRSLSLKTLTASSAQLQRPTRIVPTARLLTTMKPPSTYTNKKHKTEFGTHHESTFALIQGMKRKLEFPGPSWTHTRYPNATHVLVHLSSNRAHFFQFRQPLSSWCASVIKNLSLRMWTATSAVVAWGYSRVEKKWFT